MSSSHVLAHWIISLGLILIGAGALWVATLKIPDVTSFSNRKIGVSTKIYDRTGTVLLFDTGQDIKRTGISLSEISPYIPKAAIAIEDSTFYTNFGIRPLSIIRAVVADILSGSYEQGASTITQQVVKNSLLTTDKTITRKIKEWVLAVKLTRIMSKDDILQAYLNETSYGGVIYGVEEASQQFFGHSARDATLAEAAYLAAIPQAPTYYSPYGTHTNELTKRASLVLSRMKELGMITDEELEQAVSERPEFLSKGALGIKAPHFVMYVRDELVSKYGEETVSMGGLKVTTTLDYDMQQKAEAVIERFAPDLALNFNASNTAMVAIDPKTGDILTMVGSKDYFDHSIDGNFNVSLANRQPGSTFKPFVYAAGFNKGFTPDTILWDIKTEFSIYCNPDGTPKAGTSTPIEDIDPTERCYSPGEFDDTYGGPMKARYALPQSRNIPAVQMLYLAGIPETIRLARGMGLEINNPNRCGLTLVLGGCEVNLLDLVSAYGVFANDGARNAYRAILEVYDHDGKLIEKAQTSSNQAIPQDVARQINDILSDTSLRMNSLQPIGRSVGRPVAIKTGTTNDFHDVWTLGYTPNLVVGAWAGNNDNSAMQHNVAGLIISPLWGAFMSQVADKFPQESFGPPPPPPDPLVTKPYLRGVWRGGVSYWKDTVSGKVATQYTPAQTREEVVFNNVHSILYWIDKDNINGPAPMENSADSQFPYWEYALSEWLKSYQLAHPEFQNNQPVVIPTITDDVHIPQNSPLVTISSPTSGSFIDPSKPMQLSVYVSSRYPVQKTDIYLNGKYIKSGSAGELNFSFVPNEVGSVGPINILSVTVYDAVYNSTQATTTFTSLVP